MSRDSRGAVARAAQIEPGIRSLPPAVSALFEMRFVQGLSAAEIGAALSREPHVATAFVERMLKDGFEELADHAGAYGDAARAELAVALMELPAAAWRQSTDGQPPVVDEPRPPVVDEPRPPVVDEPRPPAVDEPPPLDRVDATPPSRAPRRRSRMLVVLGAFGGVAGGFAILALAGGADQDPDRRLAKVSTPPAKREAARPQSVPRARSRPVRPVAVRSTGSPIRVRFKRVERAPAGRGKAGRRGGGPVRVHVRGLPPPNGGNYSLWAYDSPRRAQLLGRSPRPSFMLAGRLPRSARRFRYLDISLQPPGQLTRHSDISVLRARLAPLAR